MTGVPTLDAITAAGPFEPALIVLLALFAAVPAVLAARACRRPIPSALLRLSAIALISALLLDPSRTTTATLPPEPPPLRLLIDVSQSMSIADSDESQPRIDAARRWLTPESWRWLSAFSRPTVTHFGARTRAASPTVPLNPTDDRTHLARALSASINELEPLGGGEIVLITDGVDTDNSSLKSLANSAVTARVHVHTRAVGSPARAPDLRVTPSLRAPTVSVGESTQLTVQVALTPSRLASGAAILEIDARSANSPPSAPWTTIERRPIALSPSDLHTIDLDPAQILGDRVGTIEYRARVAPIPNERSTGNNQRTLLLRVTDAPIRVLLLEGEPHWDSRFLLDALRRDPRVQLTSVQALGIDRSRGEPIPRLHASRFTTLGGISRETSLRVIPSLDAQGLARFDVVVLGRSLQSIYAYEPPGALAEYVQGGGAVLFARGDPLLGRLPVPTELRSAIASISPIDWSKPQALESQRVGVVATPEGEAAGALELGVALEALPAVRTAVTRDAERSTASVWVQSDAPDPDAVVVHAPIGEGQAVAVAGQGLWRWAFTADAGAAEPLRGAFDALWSNLVRWLALGSAFAPGEDLSISVDPSAVGPGESARIIVRGRTAGALAGIDRLTVEGAGGPGGATQMLDLARDAAQPRRLSGVFSADTEGVYALRLAVGGEVSLEEFVTVEDRRIEFADTATRSAELAALSNATGGLVLGEDGLVALGSTIEAARGAGASEAAREPIWDRGWVYALLAVVLGAEWFLRRQKWGGV